ncbi:CsgG/HfaB family protein [Acetonema longum]|uniref:CsgG family protein n=1 Tax=Acetonema longum DSM 6540 TaxID=1009370 RepID=F7NIY6_9FIRM|nr:CsgG/HfaB family protein [Acetonema longum]EGO63983.1 CsgG family protein [Acetonema longum DSM 6540]
MDRRRARAALFILFFIAILFISISVPVAQAADQKPIGILEFEAAPQVQNTGLTKRITGLLTESLITNRSYQVIGPERTAAILAEQNISVSGFFEGSMTQDVKQIHGLDYLVTGKIIRAESQDVELDGFRQKRVKVVLAMRLINARSGEIIFAQTAVGETRKTFLADTDSWKLADPQSGYQEALQQALAQLTDKIQALNPLSGLVIEVHPEDNSVVIDLGSEQGASVGQQYLIYQEGTVVVHPVNRQGLGKKTKSLAVIKIFQVQNQHSTGQVVSGKWEDIKPLQPVSKL